MKDTFGQRVIKFNKDLHLGITLPGQIRAMNPFSENPEAFEVSSGFW